MSTEAQNFRNEIVWRRTRAHSDAKQGAQHYGRVHDVLLFYSKSDAVTWNQRHIPHDEEYVRIHYPYTEAKTKRRYGLWDMTGPGGAAKGNPHYEIFGIRKYWRYSRAKMEQKIKEGRVIQPRPGAVPREIRYLDETAGIPVGSVWTDIAPINSQARERVGFPTQKPNALLGRIVEASSNAGDTILDPFCGCGTAVVVAEQRGRQWVGIDITDVALEIIKFRLQREIGPVPYVVKAIEPRALPEAIALARKNRKDFETWALGLVGARPDVPHQGADRGIDARFLDTHGQPVVVSVKSGKVTASQVRDLRGVIDRESALVGVFITLYQPTKAMIREAATAGTYEGGGGLVPRIQILTIAQLLDPKARRLEYPVPGSVLTRPPTDRHKRPDQFRLPLVSTIPGGKTPSLPRQEVPTAAPPPYAARLGRASRIGSRIGGSQQLGIEIEEAVPWQLARQQPAKAPSRRAADRRGTYRRRVRPRAS